MRVLCVPRLSAQGRGGPERGTCRAPVVGVGGEVGVREQGRLAWVFSFGSRVRTPALRNSRGLKCFDGRDVNPKGKVRLNCRRGRQRKQRLGCGGFSFVV